MWGGGNGRAQFLSALAGQPVARCRQRSSLCWGIAHPWSVRQQRCSPQQYTPAFTPGPALGQERVRDWPSSTWLS